MSSEVSPSGPEHMFVEGIPGPAPGGGVWQSVERGQLLSKMEMLERRARHLVHLEDRLRDLNREVKVLHRLSEVSHAIHTAPDVPSLLETTLKQCTKLLGAECASIFLHDSAAGELVLTSLRGRHPHTEVGTRVQLGEGVAGFVAARQRPVRVVDIEKDGRFPVRNSGRYATNSFLCVPAVADAELLAVLCVTDRSDGEPFRESDLRVAVRLARDLTTALRRLHREREARDEHVQFVSKLAHELRNPLDGVLRFLNLSLSPDSDPGRRERYLETSKQGVERVAGIVSSLTGFYRHARTEDEAASLNDCVRQAVSLQDGKAEQRDVRVAFDLADDVPPVRGGSGLFQVFTNIIANAYDAMADGGGTLSVSSRLDGDRAIVQIRDTGPGMPPDVIERVFTPFFTTKPPGKGMGLGLAVCREIVSRLDGWIEVDSTPGEGTAFTITVPCAGVPGAARL